MPFNDGLNKSMQELKRYVSLDDINQMYREVYQGKEPSGKIFKTNTFPSIAEHRSISIIDDAKPTSSKHKTRVQKTEAAKDSRAVQKTKLRDRSKLGNESEESSRSVNEEFSASSLSNQTNLQTSETCSRANAYAQEVDLTLGLLENKVNKFKNEYYKGLVAYVNLDTETGEHEIGKKIRKMFNELTNINREIITKMHNQTKELCQYLEINRE